MIDPIVIGIGHKKGTGKDTIAARLVDKHGFIRLSFADPVKEACRIIFHFNDQQLYGDLKEVVDKRWQQTPRYFMQRLGTEACRNVIDKDIWGKSLLFKIQDLCRANTNSQLKFVIPDVRFENEVETIKSLPLGFVWKVERDIPLNAFSQHESEIALDSFTDWDMILDNRSTMANLYQTVDTCLARTLNQDIPNVFHARKA
jgi:hypothetical protein